MNYSRIRRLMTLVALVLGFCLFSPEQPTSAQSPNRNCKQAKGNSIEVFPGGGFVTTGTITNGGILNGTTEFVYSPAFVFTPDPTVGSYTADMTITTIHGQLKTNNVYLYDFATGLFTILGRINSDTSTGRFAGAEGVLFFGGKTIGDGFTYQADITGEICFANE
jgi:hypothetical protein